MKMFLLKRKRLTAAVCLLLAAGMFYVVNHPAIVGAAAAARQLPIYCVQRDQKVLSISFDAAWGNEDTQMLIDILGKYKIKATFFVVGEWVDKYPESVKALHDAGHEVMNHSNTHAHMSQLSKEEIIADVEACNDKIEAVTGVRPTLIRPPYGEYDDNVITAIRSIGMEPIQWDVDTMETLGIHWGAGASALKKEKWRQLKLPERVEPHSGSLISFLFFNGKLMDQPQGHSSPAGPQRTEAGDVGIEHVDPQASAKGQAEYRSCVGNPRVVGRNTGKGGNGHHPVGAARGEPGGGIVGEHLVGKGGDGSRHRGHHKGGHQPQSRPPEQMGQGGQPRLQIAKALQSLEHHPDGVGGGHAEDGSKGSGCPLG